MSELCSFRAARAALCLVAVAAVSVALAEPESWNRFRGPGGNATGDAAGLPLTWSDAENIAWKTPLPGPGSSSPIVSGGKIFLTCYQGYGVDPMEPGDKSQLTLHTLCLDRASGQVLWDRSIPASSAERDFGGQVTNHGYATPTPVCDDEAVYCSFGCSGVVAYDLEGTELWRAELGTGTSGFGTSASPIVWEDLLIVNASIECQSLIAFDKRTGREVWRVAEILKAYNTPNIVVSPEGRPELIVNRIDHLLAFTPRTGEPLWNCTGIDDYVCPSVIAHDHVVYAIGGRSRMGVAVRTGGSGDVTETHQLWSVKAGANVTSPVYYAEHLYWLDDRGVFYCVRAEDGETIYRERTPAGNRVYASVVLVGDRIYAVTRESGTLVFRASPEFELLAQNELVEDGTLFNASPAVDAGQMLLRSDRFLYCIGGSTAAGE